ncbi:TPA: hypothetical protein QD004_000337 [Shewanella algae]|uniref:hypothetical protein n=1 Tax=Shewanella algae TaxID=38313 RepID=UPI001C57887D|nr:hypothetical protein [Shewanella algae]HDS1201087.1 hypothetical protein [Shewanella algae]
MKFELIRDRVKAESPQEARPGKIEFEILGGTAVCYHQPLYENPFTQLLSAIYEGSCLNKLKGRYYKIQSNGGYLHEYYPAVEYYKIAYRMIRDNIHTISLAKAETKNWQDIILSIYTNRKEQLPSGQSKLSFDKEIYQLRASLTTYIFSVRAVLDTVVSLFPTIYGPQIGQHISFNGFMKHFLSNSCSVDDPDLKEYLKFEMEWFVLLKDVRDYLAHFGAVHFSIKEISSDTLHIEMFRGMTVNFFIETVDSGFQSLLKFLDEHCSNVAKRA